MSQPFTKLSFFIFCTCFTMIIIASNSSMAQLSIAYDTKQQAITYAVEKLRQAMLKKGESIYIYDLHQSDELADIHIVLQDDDVMPSFSTFTQQLDIEALQPEGYSRQWINENKNLLILAADAIGAEYALLELAEVVQSIGNYQEVPNKTVNPSLKYRIVKFNLPWSPYRESMATEIHMQTCRDLQFWERFLDMMAENRLNVLSLWNKHPFSYMIKSTNYPEATPLSDLEMEEWQAFWKSIFRMAKVRGIQTFIVNWNIVVSPEFASAYDVQEYNDLSEKVIQYTRESVTQTINEYEDLTGIGVTLADWMGNFGEEEMTPQKREEWIEATFVQGMKDAERPVKFLHRSVLAGDPMAMRKVLDNADLSEPALVEVKFNWSHGHSTPTLAITHDYHSGELDERFWKPKPENYNIQWMIRNEDFFILRWGQSDFIRQHIATNNKDYVNGYFIGSEGYIPALDYSHKISPVKTWQYAFEKQWLFYKMWGRLLYNPDASDSVFATAFDIRYGQGVGDALLKAYQLASHMPLRLASFHRSTWDYTLYSEGFIEAEPSSPDGTFDRSSPFISINEFIDHETLDPNMLSIPDYVFKTIHAENIPSEKITPLELADVSEEDSWKALHLADSLREKVNPFTGALQSELDDVTVWGYLGLYLSEKLRAGVALENYRNTGVASEKQKAISHLESGLRHWDKVISYTKNRYLPTPHVSTQHYGEEYQLFSWELLRPEVVRDIQLAKEAIVTE